MIGPIVKLRFSRAREPHFGLEFSDEQLFEMEQVFGEGSLGNREKGVKARVYVLGAKGLVLAPVDWPVAQRLMEVDWPESVVVSSLHRLDCSSATRAEDYLLSVKRNSFDRITSTLGVFGGSLALTSFFSYCGRQFLHIPLPEEKDRRQLIRRRVRKPVVNAPSKAKVKASSKPPSPVLKVTGPLVGTVEALVNFPSSGQTLKQVLLDIPLEEAIDLVRQYGRRE